VKILFITFGLPVPPSSGARIRDFNLISRVARKHEVSVLSLLEFPEEQAHMQSMQAYCQTVDGIVADRSWLATLAVGLRGLLAGRPLATAPFYYPALARRINQLTQQVAFDIVQIEHSFLAPYRADLAAGFGGACVLSLHNIGVQQYRSMLDMSSGIGRIPATLKWLLLRGWDARAARQFDLSVVVSDEDRERLESLEQNFFLDGAVQPAGRISVVENGVDCMQLLPLPEPLPGPWPAEAAGDASSGGELVFVGTMGYLPNRDAMQHFCREVLPLVHSERPQCRLTIVGSGGQRFLSHLAKPGQVEVTDRVEDVVPFYRRAHVAIAPLRSGGGSRLKILEAMALGRPVVSSRLGCEGLVLTEGEDLLIADEPGAMARRILDLLSDRELWRSMVKSARQTVVSHYDWSLVAGQLLEAYAHLRPAIDNSGASPLRQQWSSALPPPRMTVIIPVYNAIGSLDRCLDALARSLLKDFELIVVDDHSTDGSEKIAQQRCGNFVRLEKNAGQGAARNRGAAMARSDLLFFLDSDVLVEPDTLDNILQVLAREPDAAATFCSYQSDTPAKNFASQYKNLLHHYTHQVSRREAATFCGGFGAIRRDVFLQMGGFDEIFRAMEDVELGYRLHQAGHRVLLSPQIQLTHTKRYTLASLVRADVFQRAIPWTRIMLQRRIFQRDLNLRGNHQASLIVLLLMLLAPFFPAPILPNLVVTEAILLVVFILLNQRFLAFLWRSRGGWFALRSVPMLGLQYGYSGVGLVLGVFGFMGDVLLRNNPPGPAKIR
jgi:GT2 family glycosyltransferase/glycosyltransferase involved in cell wall biosynthesis